MWKVIDRLTLTWSLIPTPPDNTKAEVYYTAWRKAGSILKAVYRWTKDKRNTTRKGSAEYKRYTTLMDKLQQEIKRG